MIYRKAKFIEPKYNFEIDNNYFNNYRTYSEYNYLNMGLSSYIKRLHFEKALELAHNYSEKANVIDFGCADGCLLPSLSNYFPKVLGIDINPDFIDICQKLITKMNLKNSQVVCNQNLNIENLKSIINHKYDVMFLLEVLEHIGRKNKNYNSKIEFLLELSSLIKKDGLIIISVPNMVGLSFLLQRIGLSIFGMHKEEISWKQLINASLLKNTDELEKGWNGGHLGFNHNKLENYLEKEFEIISNTNLIFQTVYSIKQLVG